MRIMAEPSSRRMARGGCCTRTVVPHAPSIRGGMYTTEGQSLELVGEAALGESTGDGDLDDSHGMTTNGEA